VDGLWGCGPGTYNGFVFDDVLENGYCSVSGIAPQYHLRLPQDGLWSCLQVTNYVYDQVEVSGLCSATGVATIYHLRQPVDGLWACGPGTYNGYTYDEIQDTASCVTVGISPLYHLRLPEAGLWACAVPTGWLYSQLRVVTTCQLSGTANEYLLEAYL